MKLCPAVILPQRCETFAFGAAVKVRLPLPLPELADPSCIQCADVKAVQEHPIGAVIWTEPLPPLALNEGAAPIELGQTGAGAYETLTLRPAGVAEFMVRLRLP